MYQYIVLWNCVRFICSEKNPHKYSEHLLPLGFVVLRTCLSACGCGLPCSTGYNIPIGSPAKLPIIPHPDHCPACEWMQGTAMAERILCHPELCLMMPGPINQQATAPSPSCQCYGARLSFKGSRATENSAGRVFHSNDSSKPSIFIPKQMLKFRFLTWRSLFLFYSPRALHRIVTRLPKPPLFYKWFQESGA